jgi:hypothetical protein
MSHAAVNGVTPQRALDRAFVARPPLWIGGGERENEKSPGRGDQPDRGQSLMLRPEPPAAKLETPVG